MLGSISAYSGQIKWTWNWQEVLLLDIVYYMGSFGWFWGFQPSALHPEIQSHMSDNNKVLFYFQCHSVQPYT